jgi:hypothetical protein
MVVAAFIRRASSSWRCFHSSEKGLRYWNLLGTLPVNATSLYSLRSDILDLSALASFTIGRAMCVLLRCEVPAMCISARYSLLSVAVAHDGIDGDEQPQSPRAPSNRTPVMTKKRTTYPAGTERSELSQGAPLLSSRHPSPQRPRCRLKKTASGDRTAQNRRAAPTIRKVRARTACLR